MITAHTALDTPATVDRAVPGPDQLGHRLREILRTIAHPPTGDAEPLNRRGRRFEARNINRRLRRQFRAQLREESPVRAARF